MTEFETVIGLEVHCELSTKTKIFCGCSTKFGAAPNSQVCPVCLGLPGTLPVMNAEALERAILVGLAVGCTIRRRFKFDRKHYYYPDLPKNFQISQYDLPLAHDGRVDLAGAHPVRVKRVHLEEDAGKLVHEGAGQQIATGTAALVDYNRSGMPLLEIVSEPDLREPAEAVAYVKSLQTLVRYLHVSDGNMEEGSLRCDANISVRPKGADELGAKIEIKNMNSFKSIEHALTFEARRQRDALARGETLAQETRLWDDTAGETRSMRSKEAAHDYRYFPEPDLLVFTMDDARLAVIRGRLPELPWTKRLRYVQTLGLTDYDAGVLTSDRTVAEYFEATIAAGAPPKTACNWVSTELLGALHGRKLGIGDSRVAPRQLAALIALIDKATISGKIAKTVFAEMLVSGADPDAVVKAKGLVQITDEDALVTSVRDVLAANPQSVADFKAGKSQTIGFLVGQVMKATGGKANPQAVNKILKEELTR
ncbi:MAG: Asp-tRNA(Asn)/Glu-tRNA(Gln) amidotransferase subunit GatB [Candidatus Coatesbacteria bacterium]